MIRLIIPHPEQGEGPEIPGAGWYGDDLIHDITILVYSNLDVVFGLFQTYEVDLFSLQKGELESVCYNAAAEIVEYLRDGDNVDHHGLLGFPLMAIEQVDLDTLVGELHAASLDSVDRVIDEVSVNLAHVVSKLLAHFNSRIPLDSMFVDHVEYHPHHVHIAIKLLGEGN